MHGFIIICVAVIIFNASMNTLVSVNETKKSTNRIEQAINNTYDKDNETASEASEPNASEAEKKEDKGDTTIINNYNGDYYDNYTVIEKDNDLNRNALTNDDSVNTEEYNDNNNNNEDYWSVADESQDINYDKCPRCGEHTYSYTYNSYDPSYSYSSCDSCGYFLQ